MELVKFQQIGSLIVILIAAKVAEAGTGRQTTTFLVDADSRAVSRWIEQNSSALDESTGAEVLSVHGRQSRLRKQSKEGIFTLIVDHGQDRSRTDQRAQFRTVLVKSDNPALVSQETEIRIEREGDGSRVTITVVATVSTHSAMAISLGIRPALRGMRKLLESHFSPTNEP
jgi:hypothetical protein